MRSLQAKQQGFTLIELIVVIVLLGVIGVGATGFIVSSAKGFSDLSRREGIAGSSRVAMDRMVRELRNALPNSPRTNGDCLEFIPSLDATQYLTAPITAAASSLSVVPFTQAPEAGRLAIFPITTAAVYATGSPAVISPLITTPSASLVSNAAVTINLAGAHQFPLDSPAKRLFIVGEPVSYCVVGNRIYRYTGYARSAVQPTAASLPTTEPNRALISYPITAITPFQVLDATLQRNAIVMLEFSVEQSGESLLIQQEVQLRNAP